VSGVRRRLLIVSDTLGGGHGATVTSHAAWFGDHGWEVMVAAPTGEPNRSEPPNHVDLPFPKTLRDVAGMLRVIRGIRRYRRTLKPHVVHCHGSRSFVATRLSGCAAPFVTLHGGVPVVSDDPPGYAAVRRLGQRIMPMLAREAFSVMPHGPKGWVFTPHASPRIAGSDRAGPPTADRPTFLWMTRLDEPKRPDLFVQAMATLARTQPEARGLMAGTAPSTTQLEELIATTAAPVELLGHRSDLRDLLETSWATVMLSDYEGVPFAIEESMWTGRAVVASPIPGCRWLLGGDEYLAGDAPAVAAALARLCDPAEAIRAGEAAADRIRDLIQPDDPWPTIEKAYRR
jgi:glycosyltransferase involved in cell wall biosynthesis